MLLVLPAVAKDLAVGQKMDIAYPVEPLTNRLPLVVDIDPPVPFVLLNDSIVSCFFLLVVLRILRFVMGRRRYLLR